MTSDTVWLMILVNTLLTAFAIGNSWLIAFYNKKQNAEAKTAETTTSESESDRAKRFRRSQRVSAFLFLSSAGILVLSMVYPDPKVNVQILKVALMVGYIVLAIVFSLVTGLLEATSGNTKLIGSAVESIGQLAKLVDQGLSQKKSE
jgi:hypothetical protein